MFQTLKSNSPFSAPRDDTARASCGNVAKSDFLSLTLAHAAQSETMFGAEAFPDGQPIGGGPGYSAGPSKENASHRVDSLKSLQEALAAARAGEVVWIESGSTIDFTGVRLKIPENVTLAGDRGQGAAAGPLLYARHTGSEYHFICTSRRARHRCI